MDVVVSTPAGLPGAELLEELEAYFEERREIAVDVKVKAPTVKAVDLSVQVTAREGFSAPAVKTQVEEAIRNHFSGERLGEDVLRARLTQLVFSMPGVANCNLLAPAADVVVGPAELPQLGSLTVEVTA